MKKIYVYDKELGIAGIEDPSSKMRAYTLLQQPGIKKAAFNAYTGARYSRSDKSAFEILKEVVKTVLGKGITADEFASERLDNVVNTYGHPSVADMSHNFVCIENIPMVTMMRFFYLNPKQDGQERSTRFQDFSKPNFYITSNREGDEEYRGILDESIAAYNSLKEETYSTLKSVFKIDENNKKEVSALEARTFDTVRFLIPMGMRTSGCAVMSSRDWARYIGLMRGSNQIAEQQIGELLFELLLGSEALSNLGYVPESDVLIKHAEANTSHETTFTKLKAALAKHCNFSSVELASALHLKGVFTTPAPTAFVDHVMLLMSTEVIGFGKNWGEYLDIEFFRQASEIIFDKHYHYNQVGPAFQMGSLCIKSASDLGSMKDFNRHRSLERFIPFCENTIEIPILLSNGYGLCEYLYQSGMENIKKQYETALDSIYQKIRALAAKPEYTLEEIRNLLPHANLTPYRLYGSLDDLMYVQKLRVRPGGHINYRMEVDRWRTWFLNNSKIFGLSELWRNIGIQSPNPASHDEFIDRS